MKTLSLYAIIAISLLTFVEVVYADDYGIKFDSTVTPKMKGEVLGDLSFIQTVTSARASPLHQEIFGMVNGSNYIRWFTQRVFEFGVDLDAGPTTVAYHTDEFVNKIFVGGNYVNGGYPQIARLMTLFHEARHTETEHDFWEHAKCPRRFPHRSIWTGADISGGYACEDNAYGSYSSVSVMLNNISKFCSNCSAKVKADAKLYSDDQVLRVIDGDAMAKLQADFAY